MTDVGFDEERMTEEVADGDRTMSQLDGTRHCLKQQWSHQKEIVPANERNFDLAFERKNLLQIPGREDPAESASDNQYLSRSIRI